MPELKLAVPGNVSRPEDGEAARQIEGYTQVATVESIDKHTTDEGDKESRKGDDDDLQTYFYRGVRGGHDVPANAHEIHAAAKKGNKHGGKEITEAALRPDQLPIHTVGDCGRHGIE